VRNSTSFFDDVADTGKHRLIDQHVGNLGVGKSAHTGQRLPRTPRRRKDMCREDLRATRAGASSAPASLTISCVQVSFAPALEARVSAWSRQLLD
jgi:hypothetical protein